MDISSSEIESPADRISSLPDELLRHILSLIPNTEDKARTSAVSKRFHHLWTHQTSIRLGFRDPFFFLNPDSRRSAPAINRYILSVDGCLSSLSSPLLRSLDLILISGSRAFDSSAFRWLRLAAGRCVTDLRLGSTISQEIRIPQSIFECRTLVSLELQGCTFHSIPANFPGFPLLSRLKIGASTISDETLASLLSLCPSLRSLGLSQCWDLKRLKLSSSKLAELDILYCSLIEAVMLDAPNLSIISYVGNVTKLFLKDARCLVNANIWHEKDIRDDSDDTDPLEWARTIVELCHVSRRLRVTDWFFKFSLPESPTPTHLFANLKKLQWCTQYITAPLLCRLVPMLAQCPNLELLYIDLSKGFCLSFKQLRRFYMTQEEWGQCLVYMDKDENRCKDEQGGEVWDSSNFMDDFGDVIPRLKTIIIQAFSGITNEMKMLEYLLGRGKGLEKLIIGDCLMRGDEELHRLFDGIHRSSVNVQIMGKRCLLRNKLGFL